MQKAVLALAVVCLVALSGCSDKGSSSNTGTSSTSSTSTSPGNTTTPPAAMEPLVITGSVSGVQDCTLSAQGQAPLSAASVTIPVEAANRTYALTFSGGAPVGSSVCIGFGTDALTAGNTGTIAAGTTAARIGANAAQGATYTLTIT